MVSAVKERKKKGQNNTNEEKLKVKIKYQKSLFIAKRLHYHVKEIMEDTTWEQRLQALTHILTSPTNTVTPPLHSQFFISNQIPCYLNWDYPPILCNKFNSTFPSLHLKWGFSLFLKRVSRFGLPQTSWRSKCPFQQPPPLILAKGVEEAQWGEEQRRQYVRKRLSRKRLGSDVHPLIPILVPNLFLFSLLLWKPFPDRAA